MSAFDETNRDSVLDTLRNYDDMDKQTVVNLACLLLDVVGESYNATPSCDIEEVKYYLGDIPEDEHSEFLAQLSSYIVEYSLGE